MEPLSWKKLGIAVALLTAGCSHATFPETVHPRALAWGIGQPNCLVVCVAHVTVTDTESGEATTSVSVREPAPTILDHLKRGR
jgi:nitrite reductase/ring-hydroxylating ferredoxin subunit